MITTSITKTVSREEAVRNRKKYQQELRDKAWARVASSKLPDMVKLAILMANALELLTSRTNELIRAELRGMGIDAKPNGGDNLISGLRNYAEKSKAASYWFERDLQKFITDATFESLGVKAFDDFNHSSAEIIQLLMLCVDRSQADGGALKVFNAIHRLKAGTRFDDDDIAKFAFRE